MHKIRQRKDRESLKLLGDALRLLALSSSQLSQKRKDCIAPDLAPQYRQVCSASRPVSHLLFGDELNKSLREIKEAQNVGTKIGVQAPSFRGNFRGRGYKNQGSRFDTNPRGQHSFKPRGFLGGRQSYHKRRGAQGRPQHKGDSPSNKR